MISLGMVVAASVAGKVAGMEVSAAIVVESMAAVVVAIADRVGIVWVVESMAVVATVGLAVVA